MANDEQNKAIPQVDEVKLQPPKLSFEAITFSDGTTLKLDENDIVVFVGPNNAGKSAALHELEERVKRSTPGLLVKNATMSKKGTQENSPEEQGPGIAECIQSVLSLRTAQIRIDGIESQGINFLLMNSVLVAGLRSGSEIFAMTITRRLFAPIRFGALLTRRFVPLSSLRPLLARKG